MGLAQSALILLGIGIISEKFGAGVGLGELGTGIKTLAAAPLGGVGAGLFEFSAGLKTLGEALGDIGRGFGALFANIPQLPGYVGPGGAGSGQLPPPTGGENGNGNGLIQVGGGDDTTNLPGGGGNVPTNGPILTLGTSLGPVTGTYSQIFQHYVGMGFTPSQVHSLVDPHFTSMQAGNLV